METHKKRVTAFVILAVILGIYLILSFPQIRHDSQTAFVLFAPDRLVADPFSGRVLGTHVLQTEHGEIILKNYARIIAGGGRISRIDAKNFETGLASHNFVVEGIEIPQNISISFAPNRQTRNHQISTLNIDDQEIILSGVAVNIRLLQVNHHSGADIVLNGVIPVLGYVTLTDNTQVRPVSSSRYLGMISIFSDAGLWMLNYGISGFLVRKPGDNEFVRFRSITFRQNWGEFIEGEQ